ncbi:MAG: CDP-alcohol phosphatidyltransferase family protein [Actinomycetota bacterium]
MGLPGEGREQQNRDLRDPSEGSVRPAAPGEPRVSARLLTVPNLLSLLRLGTVPVFLWLFLTDRENAAVVLYGAGAITDFLDGYIARRAGQISELGKLMDPLADRVFIVALAVALVARGALPLWLALAVVARDLIVLSAFPLLERRGVTRIPVNLVGKTATALLLTGLTWLALTQTTFGLAPLGDEVGLTLIVAGAILYWAAAVLYARELRLRWGKPTGGNPGSDREPLP